MVRKHSVTAATWYARAALAIGFFFVASLIWPASTGHYFVDEIRYGLRTLQTALAHSVANQKAPSADVQQPSFAQLAVGANEVSLGRAISLSDRGYVDIWDSPIIYRPPLNFTDASAFNAPALIVYSAGENTIDEGGEGDDISPYQPVREGYYWKKYWRIAEVVTPCMLLISGLFWWKATFAAAEKRWPLKVVVAATGATVVTLAWLYTGGMSLEPGNAFRRANLWHLLGVSAMALALFDPLLQRLISAMAARLQRSHAGCPSCNYDLTGLPSSTCPECGSTASPPSPDHPPSAHPRSG